MTVKLNPQINQTKPITVSDLLDWCQSAIREGHANRYIFMTSDDEENSFHPALCGLGLPNLEDMDRIDSPRPYDIDKVIILS